jgi:hypothetical protein
MDYQEGTPDSWDDINLSVEGEGSSVALVGPCPRCAHSIRKSLRELLGAALTTEEQRTYIVRLKCNCSSSHPGAPSGSRGCGAEGGLEVEI